MKVILQVDNIKVGEFSSHETALTGLATHTKNESPHGSYLDNRLAFHKEVKIGDNQSDLYHIYKKTDREMMKPLHKVYFIYQAY